MFSPKNIDFSIFPTWKILIFLERSKLFLKYLNKLEKIKFYLTLKKICEDKSKTHFFCF